jgi:hypothetical protein
MTRVGVMQRNRKGRSPARRSFGGRPCAGVALSQCRVPCRRPSSRHASSAPASAQPSVARAARPSSGGTSVPHVPRRAGCPPHARARIRLGPNGAAAFSPGLRRRRYPGAARREEPNPNGVAA